MTLNRQPKFFKCPNNHVYTFGNFTAPNEKGICPDCKLVVGHTGTYGELREGNKEIKDEVDETQPGYCLQEETSSKGGTRDKTYYESLVVKLLIHLGLLSASDLHLSEVSKLCQQKEEDIIVFL